MTQQDLWMVLVFASFPLLALLIAILVLFQRNAELRSRLDALTQRTAALRSAIDDLQQALREEVALSRALAEQAQTPPAEMPAQQPPLVAPPLAPTLPPPTLPPRPSPSVPPPIYAVAPTAPALPTPAPVPTVTHLVAAKAYRHGQGPPPPPLPPRESPAPEPPARPRFEGGRLEVIIGTGWASRIGMVFVVLAASFFLRYAFAQGWIGPRVVIGSGVMAGLALMALGEWSRRRRFGIQSQVLTGGGAAVLYLTLFAALHLYRVLGPTVTFLAMAGVTALAACQALRHESETVAVFAWIAGYLVPALISGPTGAAVEYSSAAFLFAYLTLLSVAVFAVAYRYPWTTFTSLALIAAYAGSAYAFRTTSAPLWWSLGYLLLTTFGMLWLSVARRERTGQGFGAAGAVAGYVVAAAMLLLDGRGDPAASLAYFALLSLAVLGLSWAEGWVGLHVCALAGTLAALGAMIWSEPSVWEAALLAYAAIVAGGSLLASTRRGPDAQPLAVTTLLCAYTGATLVAFASPRAVAPELMLGYLGALATAALYVRVQRDWRVVGAVGVGAAFLATGLIPGSPPGVAACTYPLAYLVALGAVALVVASRRDDRVLGGIAVGGVFLALPLARAMSPVAPELVVPVYLAVAAILITIGVIHVRRWHGLEWIALAGTWGMYLVWRLASGREQPLPELTAFSAVYLLTFLAAGWLRHGSAVQPAEDLDAVFAAANAGAFLGFGGWDLQHASPAVSAPGLVALATSVLYAGCGLVAAGRRPQDRYFGPVLLAIGLACATIAIPLLRTGYAISVLWSLVAVAALLAGFRYRSFVLRFEAWVVLAWALGRALTLDAHADPASYHLIANSAALSLLAAIAALWVAAYAYAHNPDPVRADERAIVPAIAVVACGLLWWLLSLEAWRYAGCHAGRDAQQYALSAVWTGYAGVLIAVGFVRGHAISRWTALVVFACTIVKVSVFDLAWLPLPFRILAFLGLGVVLLGVSFAYQRLVTPAPLRTTASEE